MCSLLVVISVCAEEECGSFRIFESRCFVKSYAGTGKCYTSTMGSALLNAIVEL